MVKVKLSKAVKRVVIPQHIMAALTNPSGTSGAQTTLSGGAAGGVYVLKPKKKRKKLSKETRFFEKLTRRFARANIRSNEAYLDRHRRSNRRKKDGWLRDLTKNLMRGNRKGRKSLKLRTLF